MTGTKAYALLAAVAAGAVFGTASTTWAQYGGGTNTHGAITPCSLSGVNPGAHPEVFGDPTIAATYGFVQSSSGSWHVAPGCRRGAATYAPAAAAFAAKGQPIVGIGEPVHSGSGLITSDNLCWVHNNQTNYRWGLCP